MPLGHHRSSPNRLDSAEQRCKAALTDSLTTPLLPCPHRQVVHIEWFIADLDSSRRVC